MSVAIQPRVEDDPSATAISGWFVASAARVCGSNGIGISPFGGQSSAIALFASRTASEQNNSLLLLFFRKEDSSFLKERSKELSTL
jgi:hypothetical protein